MVFKQLNGKLSNLVTPSSQGFKGTENIAVG